MAPKRRNNSRSNNRRSDPDRLIELFCEASALAATTGAYVVVLARKPDGEVLQYGCPNVSSVIDRFAAAEAREEEEMIDQYVGAPASNEGLLDRIVRRYVERKRSEDPSYALKDLQWQREILYRIREGVIAGHGN